MKALTPEQFDAQIRQNLESFEMPYDATAWSRFEATLPKQPAPAGTTSAWLKGAAVVGVVVLVGIGIYQLWPDAPVADNEATVPPAAAEESATDQSLTEQPAVPYTAAPVQPSTPATIVKRNTATPVSKHAAPIVEQRATSTPAEPASTGKAAPTEENTTAPSATPVEVFLDIKMSKTSVCVGESVNFEALVSNASGLRYEWTFTDGEKISRSKASRAFQTSGEHVVTLTATKDGRTYQSTETIEVKPTPKAEINMERPLQGNIPLFLFSTPLETGEFATWKFADGRTVNTADAKHLFRRKDANYVELTVTNSHGCVVTERKSAAMDKDFNLFAYSAFTPNGDVTNESFLPKALEVLNCEFVMVIHNKDGKEIYRTTSVQKPWDGRDNSGTMQPKGTYFWTVELKEPILQNRIFSGEIKLLERL